PHDAAVGAESCLSTEFGRRYACCAIVSRNRSVIDWKRPTKGGERQPFVSLRVDCGLTRRDFDGILPLIPRVLRRKEHRASDARQAYLALHWCIRVGVPARRSTRRGPVHPLHPRLPPHPRWQLAVVPRA